MTEHRWLEVDRYINDLFVGRDDALDAALASSAAAGLPPINVSPAQGKFLFLLAQIHGARRILEIGTLGGYSTIWLARALPSGGHLVTLEAEPAYAEVARANIDAAGLSDVVEVKVGLAADTMRELIAERAGPFDLVFIDADKQGYPQYFELSLDLSRQGTVIVADNVVRDGGVIDRESDDVNIQGVRRFNELVAAEPRVDATAIQTVGQKGYDGFAICVVTNAPAG